MRRLTLFALLARFLLVLQLLWLPQAVMAAAYATSGQGKYKNEILWLTWGNANNPLGSKGQPLTGSNATSKAQITVASGLNLDVACRLEGATGDALESYLPGTYAKGDRLNKLYAASGGLVTGIVNKRDAGKTQFDVVCDAQLGGAPTNIQGFVIADAESMSLGEYIESTAQGEWFVIDSYFDNSTSNYTVKKTAGLPGESTIRVSSSVANPGNTAVHYLKFSQPDASKRMSFFIKGEGKTAIAIGLVVPYADFGDAPASYGDAMHLIDDVQLAQDGLGSLADTLVKQGPVNKAGFQLGKFLPSVTNYLGTRGPDSELSSEYSADASGDDTSGQSKSNNDFSAEEDAWPQSKTISILNAGQPYTVTLACKGAAPVAGWIDFNKNGAFDANERSSTSNCNGSQVELTWEVPATIQSGQTVVRLRMASEASQIANPTGLALDGEVEDHQMTIVAPELAIAKTSNAPAAGWTVGQAGATYTLTVSNRSAIPTGPGPASVWKPLKVLDLMPDGVQPGWNGVLTTATGWSCSYSGQLVTCENASTHLGAAGSATAQSVIELPVQIGSKAVTGAAIINYASVGGGMDPHNGGEPPAPGACSIANYCASASVIVKAPAVSVSKIALPADQSQVAVDDTITYTLQVTVVDSATLSPVVLTDELGAGLEYVGIATKTGNFEEGGSGSTRTFTLDTGAAPGNYAVSYRAKVLASAVKQVENKVTPAGGGDPTDPTAPAPACLTCSTVHSLESPVVTVSKSSDPVSGETVKAGQTITYTLTTVVARSQTVSPVVLSDTLGSDLRFGVVVANDGFVPSGAANARVFTLPAGAIPGTYVLSYTAQVNPDASTNLTNVVTASGGGNPTDPAPVCTSCATDHKQSDPQVEYSKTTTAVKAQEKDEIEYEVVVNVSDAQTTAPVTITDTLGAGLSYVANSDSGDLVVLGSGNGPLTLTLPTNTVPGTYRVKYRVLVEAGAVTPLTNAVEAIGGGTTPVCTPGASCQTSTPLVISDVRYGKTVTPPSPEVKVGDELTFTLTVDVKKAPTLGELVLVDTLGTGLEFVTPVPTVTTPPSSNWGISASGQTLTIKIPEALAMGTHTYSYKAKVTKEAAGSVKNAVVGTGYDKPSCAINCATETPVAQPEVSFSKTSSFIGKAVVGAEIPYKVAVKVSNASLTEAVSSIVDNLSQGLEFVAVTPAPGFSYEPKGQSLLLTFPKGTEPGDYEVNYVARVTAAALTSVNNRVDGVPATEGVTPVCAGDCVVTTEVERKIDAVDDPLPPVKSNTGSTNAGNAYTNDTLNGEPVDPAKITGTVLTPATPIHGGSVPVLDVNTGIVSVAPGTPAGDYTIVYQICDKLLPTLCDTATITIQVTASPIEAKDDSYIANRGSGGDQEVGNAYSENDTLDGTPFTPDSITGAVTTPAQPIGGNPLVPVLDVVTGKVTVPSGTPAGEYKVYYRICEKLNPSNCDDAVVTVTVKADESLLRIVKTAAVRTVKIGDLVRYSLQVQNIGAENVVNANVVDTAANGFTFVNGSMSAVGLGATVAASGVRPVQFSGVTLEAGKTGTITYLMRVGAGVRSGNHVNTAFAKNGVGDSISNQATASVELVSDPLLDDSLIFGTVFDDRDRDGWQDSAKLSGLKAQGGFAPSAYIANSTTVDKGQGAEPAADASAPLLHGLDLGSMAARQSEADPVAKHTVVIHQKLQSLDFTDDFVLSNDQGVTVRMDAAGQTRVEKSGEAAAGRNAAAIEVERKISQTADGYGVDYIIRSTGIDERGIPGVRVASVEGLLMETDPFGRYHLVGINGGRWERGRHFILKVDPSTLPAGAEFTTSNPLLRRITPGLPVRFDFGVQLNPEFMAGGQKIAEIELGSVLFAAGSTDIRSQYLADKGVIAQVAAKVQQYQGGELVISANGESEAVAFGRAQAVRQAVIEQLSAEVQAATTVTVRADVNDAGSLVSGVTAHGAVLGNVLFATDKAVVQPQYQELLKQVAAYLNSLGGGVVSIVGHTDVRASHTYNQKLGLARSKAVYEALLPYLSEEVRQRMEVELQKGTGHDGVVAAKAAAAVTAAGNQEAAGAAGVNPVPFK